MTKQKAPLLSLGARGTLGDTLTYQHRSNTDYARQKPTPTDPRSLAQLYQRWDYHDYAYQWHSLTGAQKLAWRIAGSAIGLPAFAAYMRDRLNTLPDIVGRWRLDERSGSVAADSSKNNNPGTVIGALPTPGLIDYARDFDGVDDGINLGSLAGILPATVFTYLTFFYSTDVSAERWVFAAWPGGGNEYILFRIKNSKLQCFIFQSDHVQKGGQFITALQGSTWYHVAIVADGTVLTAYLNGIQDARTFAYDGTLNSDSTASFTIGFTGAGVTWKGKLDHCILYNRVLSLPEILTHSERRYPV